MIFFADDLSTVFEQEVKMAIANKIENGSNNFIVGSFGKACCVLFSKNTIFNRIAKQIRRFFIAH